jgi:hypothetical protein
MLTVLAEAPITLHRIRPGRDGGFLAVLAVKRRPMEATSRRGWYPILAQDSEQAPCLPLPASVRSSNCSINCYLPPLVNPWSLFEGDAQNAAGKLSPPPHTLAKVDTWLLFRFR